MRYQGLTYHNMGNNNTSAAKIHQSISEPQVKIPQNYDLNIDFRGWIENAKVLVLVTKLIKIPSYKDKLLNFIEGPKEES